MKTLQLYLKLKTMSDRDIMMMISASIEYMLDNYECTIDELLKTLKEAHEFVEEQRK